MSDFIGHYKGVISEAQCDEAMDLIYSNKISSVNFRAGSSQVDYMFESYDLDLSDPAQNKINNVFKKVAENAINDYFKSNNISEFLIDLQCFAYSHSNIDKIDKGIGLPLHYDKEFDNEYVSKRNFIIVVYLNNIQEGGELVFPLQQKIIVPVKGDLVIIPSFFTHPHWVNPSLLDDRYAYHVNYHTRKN